MKLIWKRIRKWLSGKEKHDIKMNRERLHSRYEETSKNGKKDRN